MRLRKIDHRITHHPNVNTLREVVQHLPETPTLLTSPEMTTSISLLQVTIKSQKTSQERKKMNLRNQQAEAGAEVLPEVEVEIEEVFPHAVDLSTKISGEPFFVHIPITERDTELTGHGNEHSTGQLSIAWAQALFMSTSPVHV